MKTLILHQDKLNDGILGINRDLREELFKLGKQLIKKTAIKDIVKVFVNSQNQLELNLFKQLSNNQKEQLKKISLGYGLIVVNETDDLWSFQYVGVIHSMIMNQNHWNLMQYHQEIKKYSIYQPYYLNYQGHVIMLFYLPAETSINLSERYHYQITGNNQDGFIIIAR